MNKRRYLKQYHIYVVFTVTNTYMGKLIRLFTRNEYSHVSLSLDGDLRKMYSFARYHINSPISGGFVVEYPGRYLRDNMDVCVKVCKIPVTKSEYERIQNDITYFKRNKDEMIYNTLNAVLSLYQKRLQVRNTFTCLEFVTYLLRDQNIMTIKELESKLDQFVIYEGSFKSIAIKKQSVQDTYFERKHAVGIVTDTLFHFGKIIKRTNFI